MSGRIYGQELIEACEQEIKILQDSIANRIDHVTNCDFDWDDCFMSQRVEERGINLAKMKIELVKEGGTAWFLEYATLDGQLVDAYWFKNNFGGHSLKAMMPDGSVVYTSASTEKGLAKKGLKKVLCKRPAWFKFSGTSGMIGAYTGSYVTFPSDFNYATGEDASQEPIEVKEWSEQ